jgi:hypothetical protein
MDGFFAKEIPHSTQAPERGGEKRPNHQDFDRFTERRKAARIAAVVGWRRAGWLLEISHLGHISPPAFIP